MISEEEDGAHKWNVWLRSRP